MKLAKELIKLMSEHYSFNKLTTKMMNPINSEYLEMLKPEVVREFLSPLGYTTLPSDKSFKTQLAEVPSDLLIKVDLTIKGALFLYLNEILSWNEVKVLLNIGTDTSINLYKIDSESNLGSYDIILSLLSVLFGKVVYDVETVPSYTFERLTNDVYYWNQPNYYYGYKAALSYNNLDDILDNIDGYLDEDADAKSIASRNDVLGMLRINNRFCQDILKDNDMHELNIKTELDNLGLYNIALNIIEIDTDKGGLNNVAFDYYKAVTETTSFEDEDNEGNPSLGLIDGSSISNYSKYISTMMSLDTSEYYKDVIKIGNIIRNIQHFLIH